MKFDIKNIMRKMVICENEKGEIKLDKNKITLIAICALMLLFLGNQSKEKNNNRTFFGNDNYESNSIDGSNYMSINKKGNNDNCSNDYKVSISSDDYKKVEENRIKKFVLEYDGVEDAKVLLSIKNGKEKILAYDIDKNIQQRKDNSKSDNDNNSNNTYDSNNSYYSNIMNNNSLVDVSESINKEVVRNSLNDPYVICESEPQIKGVAVIVKGNTISSKTITDIKEAMKAYLDISLNKIKIFKQDGNKT